MRFIKTAQQPLVTETMQSEVVVESLTQPLVLECTSVPKLQELIVGSPLNFRSYSTVQCGSQLTVGVGVRVGGILQRQNGLCNALDPRDFFCPASALHNAQNSASCDLCWSRLTQKEAA